MRPASTLVYPVSGYGNTLTETKAFFGKEGSAILQTNLFTRVPWHPGSPPRGGFHVGRSPFG